MALNLQIIRKWKNIAVVYGATEMSLCVAAAASCEEVWFQDEKPLLKLAHSSFSCCDNTAVLYAQSALCPKAKSRINKFD